MMPQGRNIPGPNRLLGIVLVGLCVPIDSAAAQQDKLFELTLETGMRSVVVESVLDIQMKHAIKAGINFGLNLPSLGGLKIEYGASTDDLFGVIDSNGSLVEPVRNTQTKEVLRYFRLLGHVFELAEVFGIDVGALDGVFASYTSEVYGISAETTKPIVFVPFSESERVANIEMAESIVFRSLFEEFHLGYEVAKMFSEYDTLSFSGFYSEIQKPYALTAGDVQLSKYLLHSNFDAYGLAARYSQNSLNSKERFFLDYIALSAGPGSGKLVEEFALESSSVWFFSLGSQVSVRLFRWLFLRANMKTRNFFFSDSKKTVSVSDDIEYGINLAARIAY